MCVCDYPSKQCESGSDITPSESNVRDPECEMTVRIRDDHVAVRDLFEVSVVAIKVLIRLWDADLKSEDDALAMSEVRLEPNSNDAPKKGNKSSGKMQLELTGIGKKNKGVKVAFEWERVDDEEEEEEEDPAAGGVLFF